MGTVLGNLGNYELSAGNLDAARGHLAESLDIFRALNHRDGIAYQTLNLGLAQVLAALPGRQAEPAGALVSEPDAAGTGGDASVLTPRELDVLKLVAQGLSNPDIAQRLFLSEHTIHRHLANILRKLGLSSRAAAAAWGVRTGLV